MLCFFFFFLFFLQYNTSNIQILENKKIPISSLYIKKERIFQVNKEQKGHVFIDSFFFLLNTEKVDTMLRWRRKRRKVIGGGGGQDYCCT